MIRAAIKAVLRTLACLAFWLLAASSALAQPDARLTGRITDDSGAALPGVTVTIAAPVLPAPVSMVSDAVGRYDSPPLPAGSYTITFELSGFEPRQHAGIELRAGAVYILDRDLSVATVKESVEVIGTAPLPATAPPRFVAPPRPQIQPVPKEVLASVCGPNEPAAEDRTIGTIIAHRDESDRTLLGDGDLLVLDAGDELVATGDNYVVRRRFKIGDKSLPAKLASFGEQTAGLIQIVEATPEASVAVVVYACGEFYVGDSIEPFDALPMLSVLDAGTPQFDDPARIVFGEHGQEMAAPHQSMVIDRGADQGVRRGQRLTIFRRPKRGRGPRSLVGNAIVVAVRPNSATIRLERASDAVNVGDLVALHR